MNPQLLIWTRTQTIQKPASAFAPQGSAAFHSWMWHRRAYTSWNVFRRSPFGLNWSKGVMWKTCISNSAKACPCWKSLKTGDWWNNYLKWNRKPYEDERNHRLPKTLEMRWWEGKTVLIEFERLSKSKTLFIVDWWLAIVDYWVFSVQGFSVQEWEDDQARLWGVGFRAQKLHWTVRLQLISKPLQGMYPHAKQPGENTCPPEVWRTCRSQSADGQHRGIILPELWTLNPWTLALP